jgi:hypothetical protein
MAVEQQVARNAAHSENATTDDGKTLRFLFIPVIKLS